MFRASEMVDRKQMSNDLREIGKLNVYTECLIEVNARLGGLESRIAISDEITSAKLTKEMQRRKEN